MITVNNEVLNWKKPTTDNEIWAAEEIKNLLSTKKQVKYDRLIFHKGDIGITTTRPGRFFDCVAKRTNPNSGEEETWKLVNTSIYNVDKKIYPAMRVREQLDITINVKKDSEKAFFYQHIFQKGLGLVGYVLNDPDSAAATANKLSSLEFSVGNMIMNQLSEKDIDIRCDAYGIIKDDKSLDLKKQDLFNKIRQINSKNAKDGYEKFIDDAKRNSPELIMRAYVNKAFRDRTLVMDNLFCRYSTGELICEVPANRLNDRSKYVTDWFMMNDDKRQVFLAEIEGSVEEIAETASDWRNITNVPKLKSIAKDIYGATTDDISELRTKDQVYAWLEDHDQIHIS